MDTVRFTSEAQEYHAFNPGQRYGQALMNYLSITRPELAEKIRGTYLDPFYTDANIPDFLDHLFYAES